MSSSTAAFAAGQVPNRVAAVTGANKGVGFFVALHLATSGLFGSVLLGCRDPARGQQAVADLQDQGKGRIAPGTEIKYLPLTVGDAESHESFRRTISESYGKLDLLVNNAGTAFKGADPTPFAQQCKPTIDINFRGTVDLTEALLPLLRKGSDPRIVNVASMSGHLSQLKSRELLEKFSSPTLTMTELRALVDDFETDVLDGTHAKKGWGNSNYGLSKLALIAATNIMARDEAANGIKVNSCCPGYCDTDMTSHKGPRPPSEGALNAVLPATMENCPTGKFFSNMKVTEW
mmetsp:Transcript_1702/g.4041  ORF Transcript_1702/g.4041 Transcript_1702/m.4041 type:complete len:290 (+) Transcript_1702:216-1085(+)|eukprot:CAMPEP_0178573504 /NCGR_PEP_ID=MMETSP0697-20121206/18816_1 /TAXON_ID=265572 /ORGANISM="Extubocellulus spinifer, Strain CCMP396" /LENGTH=289 /DNA_ID=CAMNT_0020208353 /DNA_START=186 /DNA_END=1052 /DNA_ORIENTATION=+